MNMELGLAKASQVYPLSQIGFTQNWVGGGGAIAPSGFLRLLQPLSLIIIQLLHFEMFGILLVGDKEKTPKILEIHISPTLEISPKFFWEFLGIKPQKTPKFIPAPSPKYPQSSFGDFRG